MSEHTPTPAASPTATLPAAELSRKVEKLPPYHVVLLDDNDHTYEYVIRMLRQVLGHSEEKAFTLAKEVDTSGRVIVHTAHKEAAELKAEQIHAFGKDPLIASCAGSMSAVLEPA